MFFHKRSKDPSLSEDPRSPSLRLSVALPPSTPSIIGRNTRFQGEVRGRGPLIVRGYVRGTVGIEERLVIEAGGILDAEIRANDLVVAGQARGNLQARGTLSLRSTGTIEGRIMAQRLRVEEGAIVKGTVSRDGTEP